MKNNYFGLFFGYLLVIFTGYLIGGAMYANVIFITGLDVNYYSFIIWQLIAISISVKYKKEIISKFKKKKEDDDK
jgi:hypothetical protein